MEKPIDVIIDDLHLSVKNTTRTISILLLLLGIIGITGFFSAIVLLAGFFIIIFATSFFIVIMNLRFSPYEKAIKQQIREYNKKGL